MLSSCPGADMALSTQQTINLATHHAQFGNVESARRILQAAIRAAMSAWADAQLRAALAQINPPDGRA